jgi:hypothetical protein
MAAANGDPGSSQETTASFAPTAGSITLDGRTDETSWLGVSPVRRFYEIYPANVGEASACTEARFLFDSTYIYVGIRACEPDPELIRSRFSRRDQIGTDQDFVEVMLVPLRARRTAAVFRTNPAGDQADGQYDEDRANTDFAPDFDFDVRTSVDDGGWTAELRIPFSSLRYDAAGASSWAFVINRNIPRSVSRLVSSAPMPRGSRCVLCYATEIGGLTLNGQEQSLSVVPHAVYARERDTQLARAGVDVKWQVRPNTVVDLTVAPDFSQVEADDLQFSANVQFAQFLTEKRPFFLEATDLLATPIPIVYTRAFSDPDGGVRLTHRSEQLEYTALLLRDAGGGTMIEPAPVRSLAVPQDFESTSFVSRLRFLRGDSAWATLGSFRLNDDGSYNAVIGLDADWTPSPLSRLTAQILWSDTENPDRPDLASSWRGDRLQGLAGSIAWQYNGEAVSTSLSYDAYASGFRSWNGFVSRVGASSVAAVGSYHFYPRRSRIVRVSPALTFTDITDSSGDRLSRIVAPGITLQGSRDTSVTLSWLPSALEITPVGLGEYDAWSVAVSSTPVSWAPGLSLSFTGGETLNTDTGEVGDGQRWQLSIPLRFIEKLEFNSSIAYQRLDSRATERQRLFDEFNVQVGATWHFARNAYAQTMYQRARLISALDTEDAANALTVSTRLSLTISYQPNWQTRLFFGVRSGSTSINPWLGTIPDELSLFAKVAYGLAVGL